MDNVEAPIFINMRKMYLHWKLNFKPVYFIEFEFNDFVKMD